MSKLLQVFNQSNDSELNTVCYFLFVKNEH